MAPLDRRGRAWLWVAVGVIAALGVYSVTMRSNRAAALAGLPPLPDFSHRPAAIRDHLTEADRVARDNRAPVERVGALCIAYHADLFYDEAARCYAALEALDANNWRWTYYRALVHAARGDDSAAAVAFRRVSDRAPDFSPAAWQLGESSFKAGRRDEARRAWERAAALPEPPRLAPPSGEPGRAAATPIAAYATLGLARLASSEGQADRARALLEDLVMRAPSFGPAFRLLGGAYAALGRHEDARRAIRQADLLPPIDPYVDPSYELLARESRSATFLLQQASAANLTSQTVWREHLIRRALQWDPDNTDALFELASLLRALRRFDEALRLLQDYNRRVPGDHQAVAAIGRNLAGLRRDAEAEGVLRRALAAADDPNTRYDLGVVLDRLDRLPDAIAQYEQAVRLNPNHKDALNNLGVDLARSGQLILAAERFGQLLRLDADNVEAHVNLGVVLSARGQRSDARDHLLRALALEPQHARARTALDSLAP